MEKVYNYTNPYSMLLMIIIDIDGKMVLLDDLSLVHTVWSIL